MRRIFAVVSVLVLVLWSGIALAAATGVLYFPHIASDGSWETEIGIINAAEKNLAGTLYAYDDNGGELTTRTVSLAPHGRVEVKVGSAFSQPEHIRYMKFVPNAAVANCTGYEKYYQAGQRVAVPAVSRINSGDLYVSHIAVSDEWWTGMALVNTNSSAKTITITGSDGSVQSVTMQPGQHLAATFNSPIDSAVIGNAAGIIGLELFGSTPAASRHYLSGILLTDQSAAELYYPHVASDSNWWTGIVAYNPAAAAATLTITPYTAAGTALSTSSIVIGAGGKYIGTASGLKLPPGAAWFKVACSTPITGFELFGTNDGRDLAGYTAVNINSANGVFCKTDHAGWCGIAFVNATDTAANVALTALDNDGKVVATAIVNLPGNGKAVKLAENFFTLADISKASYIRFSSDQDIIGFQLNGSADGMMLDGLPALAEGRVGGSTMSDATTGMEFVWVAGGCYQMGSPAGEAERDSDEGPVHEVCVDGFWMGKYEVTQGQWRKIMSANPAHFEKGDNYPVESVSWNEVQNFIQQLNSSSGKNYRLPSEAQWEYASRGGGSGIYSGSGAVDSVAWYYGNSNGTSAVGQKQQNGFGLYDMSGNVSEWCQDWYASDYYTYSVKNNPPGPATGTMRVLRGGNWSSDARYVRSANRSRTAPDDYSYRYGFRLVLPAEK